MDDAGAGLAGGGGEPVLMAAYCTKLRATSGGREGHRQLEHHSFASQQEGTWSVTSTDIGPLARVQVMFR